MVLALLFLAGHMVWAPRFSDRDPRHLLQRTYFFESEKGKFFAELYTVTPFKYVEGGPDREAPEVV